LLLQDLVVKKFGEAIWLDLLVKAGVTQDYADNKNYDDQTIYTLLTVASQVWPLPFLLFLHLPAPARSRRLVFCLIIFSLVEF
jgi:hypothetical protein